jgi:hypothetical protein
MDARGAPLFEEEESQRRLFSILLGILSRQGYHNDRHADESLKALPLPSQDGRFLYRRMHITCHFLVSLSVILSGAIREAVFIRRYDTPTHGAIGRLRSQKRVQRIALRERLLSITRLEVGETRTVR